MPLIWAVAVITIIGLGNPGNEYEETRHNVGFMVADALCETLQTDFEVGKGDYLIAVSRYGGREIRLVKPLTYMNNSGLAVADLIERYRLNIKDILIVCDDFTLPLGKIRLRAKGTDGGHNGLYSIIYQLRTEGLSRLRCGIGRLHPQGQKFNPTEFVLSVFDQSEGPSVRKMIEEARDAALCFATEGLIAAMDHWNAPSIDPRIEQSISEG